MEINLKNTIEAVLFTHGEPMKISALAKVVSEKEDDVRVALMELEENLKDRGLRLLRIDKKDEEVALGTAPEESELIGKLVKENLAGKLTKATLETLAIVVYYGPVARPNIDFIRGVNSSFTLRNLMIRGLIEREVNINDKRTFIYRPSMRFLQFLGIRNLEELPEYTKFKSTLDEFLKQSDDN